MVSAASLSFFSKVDQESFRRLQELDQPIFYILDKIGSFTSLRSEFSHVMKPLSSKLKFVYFSPEEVPALVKLLDLTESDYPVLVNMNKDGKYAVKNITKNNLSSSVEGIINKKIPTIKFSAKIPEDNESRTVKVLK